MASGICKSNGREIVAPGRRPTGAEQSCGGHQVAKMPRRRWPTASATGEIQPAGN